MEKVVMNYKVIIIAIFTLLIITLHCLFGWSIIGENILSRINGDSLILFISISTLIVFNGLIAIPMCFLRAIFKRGKNV